MRYGGVSLALLVLVGGSVSAQNSPSSFWAEEFLGAEVGAVVGGAIGLATVHTTCVRFERSCDPLYRVLVQQQCISLKLTSPGFHTVNMGRGLGAVTGVALIGVMHGIEGNIWAAFLATQAWVAASQQIFLLKLPLAPALVATVAYNWGATLKGSKKAVTLGWNLPLMELQF